MRRHIATTAVVVASYKRERIRVYPRKTGAVYLYIRILYKIHIIIIPVIGNGVEKKNLKSTSTVQPSSERPWRRNPATHYHFYGVCEDSGSEKEGKGG